MNSPGCVLLEREGLNYHVVASFLGVDLDQLVHCIVHPEQVGVGLLADLALECLPIHTGELLSALEGNFGMDPALEAVVVDEADGARAKARNDQGVLFGGLVSPAEPALLVRGCLDSHLLSLL